jgi:hypothetical protein
MKAQGDTRMAAPIVDFTLRLIPHSFGADRSSAAIHFSCIK